MYKLILLVSIPVYLNSTNASSSELSCLPSSAVDCSTGYLGYILPFSAYDEIFEKACVSHDYCYRFGYETYGYSRGACDDKFLTKMRSICRNPTISDYVTFGSTMAACEAAAVSYYIAVDQQGASSYKTSESKFCEYNGPSKVCSDPSSNNESCWTKLFSEESGGVGVCPSKMAVGGMWCTGPYCNNKSLLCKPVTISDSGEDIGTEWISEESPNNMFEVSRDGSRSVLTGFRCKGDYCDNIAGFTGQMSIRYRKGLTRWLEDFSEEDYWKTCQDDELVTGLSCKGSYCDNIRLQCTKFSEIAGLEPGSLPGSSTEVGEQPAHIIESRQTRPRVDVE
ncbi:hypothetical protein OTK59_23650 [Vibrio natriegens]|uniref:hypothetical protein n=1 Tax=Vibrio natriegens TaxID=691 RepID=UPI002283C5FE|nr:hypothetical protein [Vibrio natriegens]MCY9879541.1 hypothetical protein [Vibrio natriegens]